MKWVAVLSLAVLLAGCSVTPPPLPPDDVEGVQPAGNPTVIASDLDVPWSIVRLENGSALISSRDSGVVSELIEGGDIREVATIAGVEAYGEGGLLGLAVDGDRLFAYLSTADDNRIVSMPLTGEPGAIELGAASVILEGIPRSNNHNGGRLAIGPDGALYATAGDAGEPDSAQDVDSLGGKILRVNLDGTIPADNPFDGSPVWSLGHRNPQGIAWDSDGQLFAAEFGQNTWDEFNRIEAGKNYGWPVVEGIGERDGFIDPLLQWSTSEASPSGLAYIRGTFFLAALRGERVWAIYVDGDSAGATPWFEGEHGRVRHVTEGPEGSLWLLTSNTDGNGDQREGADQLIEYRLGELVEG